MDILQPLPFNKWNLLRDLLKRDWPTYASYYYLVNNSIKWKRKDPQIKLQFFCPSGDINSGTFVGISTQSRCMVYIFAFPESKHLLRQVLKETAMINWNQFNIFPAVRSHFQECFEDFIHDHADDKSIATHRTLMFNYFKPREECLKHEVSVPAECELRHLNESHILLIHSLWPHASDTEPAMTTEFLKTMLRLNRGVGLFLKEDGSLVSWVLNFDWGGLGILQTVEEQTRKGYGRIVVAALSKQLAEEENLDSFAFVKIQNIASQKLFESLGYKRVTTAAYYSTQPKINYH